MISQVVSNMIPQVVSNMIFQDVHEFIFGDDIANKALVRNFYVPATFVSLYLLFVLWVGPALMKHCKPFNLQKVIIVYNFAQMVVNMSIGYQLIKFGYNTWGDRCMTHQNPRYLKILQNVKMLIWYTYLVKLVDCLDTVFFVLRKKSQQISFLHVFHHGCVCVLCHLYLKYLRMGYYLLVGVTMNNLIHVIMYFYYALAAFGPGMRKYLWWKKYVTLLQMIQFSIFLTYLFVGLCTGCEEAGAEEAALGSFVVFVFVLFVNFYRKSFKKEN